MIPAEVVGGPQDGAYVAVRNPPPNAILWYERVPMDWSSPPSSPLPLPVPHVLHLVRSDVDGRPYIDDRGYYRYRW